MITKDGRDTAIENLTAENYIVPKGEEKVYHVVIEMKQFDPRTARRLSTPRVQKFGKKTFDTHVRATLTKQGYSITILHDPSEWLAKHQAEAKAKAEAEAAAKKAEEEKRFREAVAAEVAKQMEALKKEETAAKKVKKAKETE